jgi:predicted dehydrogenase
LPNGAVVLIQKPMGRDLAEARQILRTCQARAMTAAVNLQLRFSPAMLALRALLERGTLGKLTDIDLHLVIEQPWQLWTFMIGAPRLELIYHSIHYLDAIRAIAGEPQGVYCKAVAHPDTPQLRDTRSSIILDSGDQLRCSLVMNHTHRAGPRFKRSELMVEGTRGAARLVLGVNLDYPTGSPDEMELFTGDKWEAVPLRGSWFTEAFEGPMSNLQRFVAGEDAALVSPVEDTIKTMALIDACYQSSDQGGTVIPSSF